MALETGNVIAGIIIVLVILFVLYISYLNFANGNIGTGIAAILAGTAFLGTIYVNRA